MCVHVPLSQNLAWEAQEEAKKQQAASINLMPKLLNPIKLQVSADTHYHVICVCAHMPYT